MSVGMPLASAAAETVEIGQPAEVELVEIEVEQHWTVADLRPSTDVIAYRPAGLWSDTWKGCLLYTSASCSDSFVETFHSFSFAP